MDIIQTNRDAYNKIARHFAGTRHDLWPELEQFTPFLHNGQSILDWGCGNGRLLLMLQDFDIHYYGIDQSSELLKIAKEKHASDVVSGKAQFFEAGALEKKFPDDFFDAVFMIASFFHLPDQDSRAALLAKTFQELKNGGHLFMTLWNLESAWAKLKQKKDWEQLSENDFMIPWKNPEGGVEAMRYYHHLGKDEISELLTQAGFTIEKINYFGKTWTDDKGGRNLIVIAKKP